jgi:hypothetical protein
MDRESLPLPGGAPPAISAVDIPDSVWATHEDLSPLAVRFLRYALVHPEMAHYVDYRPAATAEWMRQYPFVLQTWPTFLGARKLAQIQRATLELTELVKRIPEVIFAGDPRRLGEFFGGQDKMLMALLLAPPTGLETCLARCDFVDDGDDLKCLEVNVGANIGGWQHRFFADICLSRPAIAAFLTAAGVGAKYRDPWRSSLAMMVEHGRSVGRSAEGRFDIALVTRPGNYDAEGLAVVRELLGEVLQASGSGCQGTILTCLNADQLRARDGVLVCDGRQIAAVIESSDLPTAPVIYRCFKAERTALYNGPLARLLGSKRTLALLSQHMNSPRLTAREREIVRRHVPWTRDLAAGRTNYQGEDVDLLEFALEHQQSLVLKPADGFQGIGVAIGCRTDTAEWRRLVLNTAGQSKMVLQEYVRSRPYLFQHGATGWAPHQAIWGTFSLGGTYGGAFLRLLQVNRGPGVINSSQGASEGLVFETSSDAP